MPITLEHPTRPDENLRFYFDAGQLQHKQNNEKREILFQFQQTKPSSDGPVLHLEVHYSQKGRKTKIESILKQARKSQPCIRLSEEQLQKACRIFRRQTEADFFIHKDARGFLREQFDLWMYQYLFRQETIFQEKRLRQLQALQQTAYDIIDLIAQFEDELRRIWEKPKFVRRVNYVITLDKLPATLLRKLAKHQGASDQIQEWKELGMVEEGFHFEQVLKLNPKHKYLPLDTKHFKSMQLEILGTLGNLDEVVDGELVHSENWQALNTLRKRYKEKVKCAHIDPPYNTKTSGFLYQNEYKHSSWLTMMENRVNAALKWLAQEGSFLCHIDENEYERLHILLERTGIPDMGTIVWDKRNPMTGGGGIAIQHEYIICRSRSSDALRLWNANTALILNKAKELLIKHGGVSDGAKSEFSRWVAKNPQFTGGEKACRYIDHARKVYRNVSLRAPEPRTDPKFFEPLLHPLTGKPCAVPPNGFSRTPDTLKAMVGRGEILFGTDETTQPRQKRILEEGANRQLSSVIQDAKRGKADLDRLGLGNFPYCHSVFLYGTLLGAAANGSGDMVLDYFAGSGTTAHAVINLNREDGGKRKYVLVEMGDYFHTVLLPRIKKVVYSKDWKDGKPVSREGVSHCFKYYALEQYEETLRNVHYQDGEQLEIDSAKSPFEQYVFFGDDKLAHACQFAKDDTIEINLQDLYPDVDIAETLSNLLGKSIRRLDANQVTFADGTTEKINPKTMTEKEKLHFLSILKPALWWGEL